MNWCRPGGHRTERCGNRHLRRVEELVQGRRDVALQQGCQARVAGVPGHTLDALRELVQQQLLRVDDVRELEQHAQRSITSSIRWPSSTKKAPIALTASSMPLMIVVKT